MDTPIRLIIADDHALFRDGLRSLLALRPELKVVAEVDNLEAIPATLESTPCDILLLDLQMNRNALPELGALAARVAVIVVTASEEPGPAIAAVRAGARAVVFKRFAVETLVNAILTVANGQVRLPPPSFKARS